ncbi:MAG: TIGR03067 domain-containing protein [Opitutaceae bacterium]|nr:TIGR03067 domain-containing protein [Opitutaceae bacterium]
MHFTASQIHGTWQVVKAEFGGQPMPPEAAAQIQMEFTAGDYAVRFGGETTDAGSYVLSPAEPHHRITMTGRSGVNAGRTIPGIMHLVGDRLRLCCSMQGTAPPAGFVSPAGAPQYLATYRRIRTP